MKAIVQDRYGSPDVLRLAEVKRPTPKDNEVLVRLHAASVNGSDTEGLRGKPLYSRVAGSVNHATRYLDRTSPGRWNRLAKT